MLSNNNGFQAKSIMECQLREEKRHFQVDNYLGTHIYVCVCMEYPITGIEIKANYCFRNHNLILGNSYLKGKIKQNIMHHYLKGFANPTSAISSISERPKSISMNAVQQ